MPSKTRISWNAALESATQYRPFTRAPIRQARIMAGRAPMRSIAAPDSVPSSAGSTAISETNSPNEVAVAPGRPPMCPCRGMALVSEAPLTTP